ncbi:MAG TPA: hypothetical protein VFY03_01855 [Woeseiaceae bacterium]|nr:hypothetical protein [Woeseiaceae bacterium]
MTHSRYVVALLAAMALALAGCSGTSSSGGGQVGNEPPPPPPLPPPLPPPSGEYHGIDRDGPYDVRATKAIVFAQGRVDQSNPRDEDLHLDLFEPDVDLTGYRVPVVVMVHGGGFRKGTRRHGVFQRFGDVFARQGFVAVSIDYRLIGQDPVLSPAYAQVLQRLGVSSSQESFARVQLAAVEDTVGAIDWLADWAADNGMGFAGVALLGESAGAVTIINLAYVMDDLGLATPGIGVVVPLWGTIGLVYDSSVITVDEAPVIMVHGTADTIVNYETGSLRIANRAASIGLPYELITNVGAGHSFYDQDLFVLETQPGSGVTQAQRIIDFIGVGLLAPECLREQGVIDACPVPAQ